jgi:hypothetical protein
MRILQATLLIGCLAISSVGCDQVDMASRPTTLVQPTPIYTGFLKPWVIYDDSLHTGEGLQIWNNCGGTIEPTTDLNVNLTSANSPHSGSACIDATFSGSACLAVQFIDTPDYTTITTAPPKDISSGNFTRCTFWARSVPAMTSTVFYAVGNANGPGYVGNQLTTAVSTQWQQYTIPITAASMKSVTIFFGIGYPNTTGDVYVDDIIFQ